MFLVYVVLCLIVLVVNTSAIDCLERLVSEMTCYVSSGTLNPTHSLTHSMSLVVKAQFTTTTRLRARKRLVLSSRTVIVSCDIIESSGSLLIAESLRHKHTTITHAVVLSGFGTKGPETRRTKDAEDTPNASMGGK